MCITLAVSAKVSAWLLISFPAFWWHSDASDYFLVCFGNKTSFLNKRLNLQKAAKQKID